MPQTAPVRRRKVFYIPGYDPFPPRRYRELYRKEGAAQAAISNYKIDLVATDGDATSWKAFGQIDGSETESTFKVLVWSDIVQSSMSSGILRTYWQLITTAWIYVTTGALRRLMWLRKGPIIAALYPVGVLILQLILALVAAKFSAELSAWLMHKLIELIYGPQLFGPLFGVRGLISLALGVAVLWLTLRWFRQKDGKIFAHYLMHDYAFAARWKGANPPELEARMAAFREEIAAALQDDLDEVLVIGHSSGAHLAISVLSDLLRDAQLRPGQPALAFLSLGQVVPMMSFLPKATRLRSDLHFLSARPDLTWVDVTAPGDGCAFALCDPVSVTGVEPKGKLWPLVISAAFTKTLSPARWKALRWRFFRLHFQYLCAFDRPGDYDYFLITAGRQTLKDRFEGRAPSASRIDVAASKYTSLG